MSERCRPGLLLLLVAALSLVSTSSAEWHEFDKGCGPADACDCSAQNYECSADKIAKFCKVCRDNLDIDDRFKDKTAFWKLKEIRGSLNVLDTSDAKVLDFKFLTTVGMSLQLGGFLSECPHNLERFLAPALTNVGTAAKMNPETGIYGDVIVGAGADGPDPKLARSIGPEEYHYLKAEPHYGSYYKIGCPSLVRFHTPGLFFIADDLIVRNNPKLVTLAFPRLHGVGMLSKPPMEYGDIIVEGNTKLAVFYAPKASLADKDYKNYDKKYAGERDGAEYMGSARIAIVKNPSLKLVVIMSTPDVKFYIDPSQNLKSLVAIYALPYKIKDGIDIFHKEIEDIEAVINEAKMKVEDSKLAGVEAVGDWFGDKLDFLKHRDYSLSDRLDKLKYDGGEQNKYDYGQVKPEPEPLPAVSADALSADTAFLGATPLDAPSPDAGDNFDI